ncbi:hypothetical protein GALL_337500 [mine drainage metagenome]|uniref:Uncharacterized protein n=1 Tax=mine drainage metagenome TaxID=410659 RepID=A0A1J5QLY8_9ZZZZ
MKLSTRLLISIFLLPFVGIQAVADDAAPTVSDAHAFLGDAIGSGLIRDAGLRRTYHNYQGRNCRSLMDVGEGGDVTSIDWSLVTSIDSSDNAVNLNGTIFRSTPGHRYNVYVAHFNIPDKVTTHRLAKAMKLLMNSCHKKSEFD